MQPIAQFDPVSRTVRFVVPLKDTWIRASINRQALRQHFGASDDTLVASYNAHQDEIHAAVSRRLAQGALEPVNLRESNFPQRPAASPPG
jgi:hypothetical protein